jgi:hypothetical protein
MENSKDIRLLSEKINPSEPNVCSQDIFQPWLGIDGKQQSIRLLSEKINSSEPTIGIHKAHIIFFTMNS